MYLENFYYYAVQLAMTTAMACVGIACWRLSKALAERWFMAASWAAGGFAALEVIYHTTSQAALLFRRDIALKWYAESIKILHVAAPCLFFFLVTFAVGAILRGQQARKVTEEAAAPPAPEV